METTGTQSQHENESYAAYMARLYKTPSINYGDQKRDSSGRMQYSGNAQRPFWGFRPPLDLAKVAYKFMRDQNMSVTTYLTYAMHNLHKKTNA